MLVYGDHRERADVRARLRDIDARLDRVEQMPCGLQRHDELSAAVIDAGQLLQGVADACFDHAQRDRQTPAVERLTGFLQELARSLCQSWDSGFRDIGELPRLGSEPDMPSAVELRLPEGFAFYAVYPEAYAEAARRLELSGPARVIGIRSIGTTLAAIVAAALNAPAPVTVRPFGDPSARTIALDPALERKLLDANSHYVIVDEGPGLSGSSFGSVADWLHRRGVPDERIALLPSHAGAPGAAATEERRRWWLSVQREVADFGEAWRAVVGRWCEDLLGILDEVPQDMSGGAWRTLHVADESEPPPAAPAFERRKFLLRARGETFLAKFAGIGRIGARKLAIARTLHSAGLIAEPIGIARGFLVERWRDDAVPLSINDDPVEAIGRYIGIRSRLLPAARESGASVDALLEMIRRNVSLEFGNAFVHTLDRWEGRADEIGSRTVRVRTDNKLDRHEWLRAGSGALIKTDALDHHQSHDLIGCQDVAWDAAGAIVEFDLDQIGACELVVSVERWADRAIDPELLDFNRVAYLAFRLGHARIAADMAGDSRERERVGRRGDFYATTLQHLLESTSAEIRHGSLVG